MRTPDRIRLIAPSLEMKNRALRLRQEYFEHGEDKVMGSGGLHRFDNFADWLAYIQSGEPGDGRVPATTFFALRPSDGALVGMANIRHYLTEAIAPNGHIGYSVRPGERGRGYGTEILRLALIKAEQLGVLEAVVSCDRSNVASRAVIRHNGLTFDGTFTEPDGNVIMIFKKTFSD